MNFADSPPPLIRSSRVKYSGVPNSMGALNTMGGGGTVVDLIGAGPGS